ncbi:hypothetical protein N4P33_29685 [Streptomyces sp. 15-116A]|uniref:hypothetical protein n=1 Tax=Streptomyces sp. 15-116A TaxID=2259035 RepID=UPI0021B15CB9|nr:hypothetical protein [Streptomyces sp. 15-116A]MCT7356287.1 hypothetical protein [Streptomyces sp. 15-116A]
MARHDSPKTSTARRALAVLATASVALGAAATTAAAADSESLLGEGGGRSGALGQLDPQAGLETATGTVGHATAPVTGLKPNPLAGTGFDPLSNGVGTQVADFQPVNSRSVTDPVARADSIGGVQPIGQATETLR